jgi:hypothetical protein
MKTRERERAHGLNQPADPRVGPVHDGPPAQQQEWPGSSEEMNPQPDHGEESYRGAAKLEGRVALITGGDSGIGRAVAIAFAREGADIAIAKVSQFRVISPIASTAMRSSLAPRRSLATSTSS